MKSYFFCIILLVFSSACTGSESDNKESKQDHDVTELIDEETVEIASQDVEIAPSDPLFSKEPNIKLVKKICDYAIDPYYNPPLGKLDTTKVIAEQMANINGLHDAYGTFAGVVEMQRSYNYHVFIKKLEDCIANKLLDKHQKKLGMNIYSFPSKDKDHKSFFQLNDWINDSYYATSREVEQEYYDNGQKDARFVSELMDSHFASIDFLSKEEKEDYKKSLIKFRSKQQDKFSVQGYSDYIAFQVFTMDRIMYWHSVKIMGLDKLRGFKKAFAEFEKAAMPKP